MEEEIENTFADCIDAGSAIYRLRALISDLMTVIAKDKDLKEQPWFYFNLYFNIIIMTALGHEDPSKDICLVNKQSPLGLSEEEIHSHISRVKSDYGEFVEIMKAVVSSKLSDFMKLGASEEEAYNCVDDWIRSELM